MERLYVFIVHNDVWIYILCALGLFWYVSELIRARGLLRRAMFGLEREKGANMRNTALLFIVALSLLAGFVYYVNAQIAPGLPAELFQPPTSTPDIFRTPLASPTPLQSPVPTITPPLVATLTLGSPGLAPATPVEEGTPTQPETPTPGPTPTPDVGCTLDLTITDPRDGATVSGTIVFNGTAVAEDFGSYRLEINGPQTNGEWASVLGRDIGNPIQDGILGSVNLSQWESGPYLLRLTLTNSSGTPTNICVTQVTLVNE